MSGEPLLPCPVCGHLPGDGSSNSGRYWRYCSRLGHSLGTPWMDSREAAVVAWNDLVRRRTEEKPRSPLPGWSHHGALLSPSTIQVINVDDWWRVSLIGSVSGESTAPRIAAEDAARAMVADMAAALGGSVTWGESEVSECR